MERWVAEDGAGEILELVILLQELAVDEAEVIRLASLGCEIALELGDVF